MLWFKRSGEVGAIAFGSLWLVGWTYGCLWLTQGYFNGARMDDGDPMPLWFPALFWAWEWVVAYYVCYKAFARKRFELQGDELVITTELGILTWQRGILRNRIKHISVDCSDGDGTSDLVINAGQGNHRLITNQRAATLQWLAQRIAHWAGLDVNTIT